MNQRIDDPEMCQLPDSERERLLGLCHTAPETVGVDTRDLETAIKTLVKWSWETVQPRRYCERTGIKFVDTVDGVKPPTE